MIKLLAITALIILLVVVMRYNSNKKLQERVVMIAGVTLFIYVVTIVIIELMR